MFTRLWAAAAVLTVIAAPILAQNPPAPPPQPAPSAADSARVRQLPRPQRPAPSGLTVNTGVANGITLDSTLLAGFRWRNIGPANMAGRVSSVAGIPSPSRTFFIAAAAGGIWKTTNAGTTFRPVFDNEKCVSMGELAIAPSDTMQVWAGTGEEDSRNTISPGCGIFKSTDGGLTWKRVGLEKSGAIGRIVVHPTNPNIVYVAALGQPWSANPERGLYKTTDGGQTWQLIKFVSPQAGFIDVAMDPSNPEVLFAASWQRQRGPTSLIAAGPAARSGRRPTAARRGPRSKPAVSPRPPKAASASRLRRLIPKSSTSWSKPIPCRTRTAVPARPHRLGLPVSIVRPMAARRGRR